MSNSNFDPYFGFPINTGLLYISCSICKEQYSSSKYAREYYTGDPSYYVVENNEYIHFCSAECASKHLYGI